MPNDKRPIVYTCLAIGTLMAFQHFAFADDATVEDIANPGFAATSAASLSNSSVVHVSIADPTTGQEYQARLEKFGSGVFTELVDD